MVVSIILFAIGLVMWVTVGRMNPTRPEFEYAATSAAPAPVATA
jgi:hypothetical protein